MRQTVAIGDAGVAGIGAAPFAEGCFNESAARRRPSPANERAEKKIDRIADTRRSAPPSPIRSFISLQVSAPRRFWLAVRYAVLPGTALVRANTALGLCTGWDATTDGCCSPGKDGRAEGDVPYIKAVLAKARLLTGNPPYTLYS